MRTEIGNSEAEQAAHTREKNAFGKQLTHSPDALRAKGGANAYLCAAANAAHQQQVGDVGAGDEKNQRSDPLQQLQMVQGLSGIAMASTGGKPNLQITSPESAYYKTRFNDVALQYTIQIESRPAPGRPFPFAP